jgi:3-hydroxyacyl-CoA dehydrogenase/enoyl-CoA hydratase/3-hydroxybutyryl-CoA epimerase
MATNVTLETDSDGIALITWDMPDRSMNVITVEVMEELQRLIEAVASDEAIKGAVIASGKEAFSGGADLTMLMGLLQTFEAEKARDREGATRRLFAESARLSQLYRRLETCGKPFVAAINGTCMGGALELTLACHGRVAAEGSYKMALPEVKVGLLPGAGGTQRVGRMLDFQSALQFLVQGQSLDPKRAKGMGLVDQVVPANSLIEAAKGMIRAGLSPKKPWDQGGFKLPGGRVYSPAGMQTFPPANAILRRETYLNYPAAQAILSCVYEGLLLPMDLGLKVESRYFAHILQTKEAAAMVRSLFVSMQELNKLARRPRSVPQSRFTKIGVLGAGFMGAGVAYITAKAGINVVILDRDRESAEKARAHAQGNVQKDVSRGRMSEADGQALLARIHPTADYADLAGCELVVEAVFEDRAVKAEVTRAAQAVLGAEVVFGSNTSTLPITGLAQQSLDPERFIGIHFFSPVEKMMLVEVILGERTGDEALARALDFCRAIRKTPIVVNDTRGFYANRCVLNYVREGHLMFMEGVPPAMIENVAKMTGMPVGPLSLTDEVALDLAWKILLAAKKDLGEGAVDPAQERLLDEMVNARGRLGRKNGKGFYDYQGKEKSLWPGLAELQPQRLDPDQIDIEELKDRFLAVQALEAARTVEEGVVTDPREADVGSILGWGFAPFTGGTLSYIDGMGAARFVALCARLAERHGERFRPNALLEEMARAGETFYGRFAPQAKAA